MSRSRRSVAGVAALVLLGSLAASPGAAAGSTTPVIGAVEAAAKVVGPSGVAGCQLLDEPRLPLELGTAVSAGMFKTVAMEKELFLCQAAAGGGQKLRDLETFVEVIESASGRLLSISVTLAMCDRIFPAGGLKCSFQALPLGPITGQPLQGCDVATVHFANDPVEMNVVANGRNVKTIKLDKEWYRCADGVAELYQFTEIFESASTVAGQPPGFKTVFAKVFGVVCRKDIPKGIVTGCRRFRVG